MTENKPTPDYVPTNVRKFMQIRSREEALNVLSLSVSLECERLYAIGFLNGYEMKMPKQDTSTRENMPSVQYRGQMTGNVPNAPTDRQAAEETIPHGALKSMWEELIDSARAEERKKYLPLLEAARGLSYGSDWNKGTHAQLHGYRQKLIDAVKSLEVDS